MVVYKMKKFIFIHIMKCGGTTLRKIIEDIYKEHYLLDRNSWERKNDLLNLTEGNYPKNYENYHVIHGHMTIDRYKHLRWPNITFLRNPTERLISEYSSMSIRRPNAINRFDDIVDYCKGANRVNIMTKMTGGDLTKFDFIGVTEKYTESIIRFCNFLNIQVPNYIPLNVTINKKDVNKKTRLRLKRLNQKDFELYEKALELYK